MSALVLGARSASGARIHNPQFRGAMKESPGKILLRKHGKTDRDAAMLQVHSIPLRCDDGSEDELSTVAMEFKYVGRKHFKERHEFVTPEHWSRFRVEGRFLRNGRAKGTYWFWAYDNPEPLDQYDPEAYDPPPKVCETRGVLRWRAEKVKRRRSPARL